MILKRAANTHQMMLGTMVEKNDTACTLISAVGNDEVKKSTEASANKLGLETMIRRAIATLSSSTLEITR
jgi:hypothetical protein